MPGIIIAAADPQEYDALAARLRTEGYQLWTARSCAELVELAEQEHSEAIVIDIDLPPYGAPTVVESLCAVYEQSEVPVILVCAPEDVEEAREAIELGASDYCTKPLDLERLVAKVELVLNSYSRGTQALAAESAAQPSGTERRRHPRRKLKNNKIELVVEGISMDISESGMRIVAPVELPEQALIQVVSEFLSELTGQPYTRVEAQVVHHHRINGLYLYGVSFLKLSDELTRAIRDWIAVQEGED